MSPLGRESRSPGNRSCSRSCIRTGSGRGMGNCKGRCVGQGAVLLGAMLGVLQRVGRGAARAQQSEVLLDVLLGGRQGAGMGMGSDTGIRVDRGIVVRNARDIPDVHTQGSRHRLIQLKEKWNKQMLLYFIYNSLHGLQKRSLLVVGGTSAVFDKSLLKHSKIFRFLLSNQETARELTSNPKIVTPA